MSSDDRAFVAGTGVATAIWLIAAVCIVPALQQDKEAKWQKQAIEHGAAQYNPITSQFEWKEKTDAK